MTRKELIDSLKAAAEPVYGEREAAAIARLIAEKRYGLTRADCAIDPDAELPPGDGFAELLAGIAAARPVQYILGTADFDGIELAVGEGVLIPRPETEELVRWVEVDARCAMSAAPTAPLSILDVGTGSGAIAIALAKNLPTARIAAIDSSPEALGYARLNDKRAGTGVELLQADALDPFFDPGRFDIIVSNPPYIPASERDMIADNVKNHEPPEALFVPDRDPLVFYRAIARLAHRSSVRPTIYFEIHETLARDVMLLLRAEGFGEITLREDINSKPRMIRCRR